LWIQPAAGDAGGALGAALLVHHQGNERTLAPRDGMRGALLGPGFSQPDIELRLSALGVRFRTLAEADLLATTVEALASQKVVGWFQGRMEFGPRALGNRSILADPRSASMREVLNDRVKRREWFRPFGPAVMAEHAADWFHLAAESPYMLLVAQARSDGLPAATNIDGSARVQTVDRESNPRFHALLSAFFERTGCPALVNTSFNVRDEPIVCTPEDAHRCFVASGCDLLVVGDCLVD
jgi:carbamoyltransferase